MQNFFREQGSFSRVREDLFGDDDNFRLFQDLLQAEPRRGDVIPGAGGARKVRWADPVRGMGRRGGIRIIYYYAEEYNVILFLFAYNKNTPDITPQRKKDIAEIIALFRRQLEKEFPPTEPETSIQKSSRKSEKRTK